MEDDSGRRLTVRSFSQDEFDAFARLSGDDNPIHVDSAYSAGTRFGRPVAHGMWLFSVLSAEIGAMFPGGRLDGIELMFPRPTYAGDQMELEVEVARRDGGTAELTLEIRNPAGDETCTGSAVVVVAP